MVSSKDEVVFGKWLGMSYTCVMVNLTRELDECEAKSVGLARHLRRMNHSLAT
jgi:hypothetical protein